MRRVCQATTAVLIMAITALGPAGVAEAAVDQTASPGLLQSNWYWHKVAADAPLAGLPSTPEPSNVPDGDVVVASRDGNGTPSKFSVIAFALPRLPSASTVSGFTLTLTIDPAGNNLTPDTPKLVAELVLRNWANGKGGDQDVVNAPPLEAATAVVGTVSADGKSIAFAVPSIAQTWLDDANFGVGIVPARGYTTPFQVSFLGGKDIKASMSYTPGTVVSPPGPSTPTDGSGLGSSGGVTPSVSVGGPPAPGGSAGGTVPAPSVAGPGPNTPVIAPRPPTTPVVASVPLAAISSRPTTDLVWIGAAVAALLVLISVILGGEPDTVAVRRRSRLSSVLTKRAAHPAGRRTSAIA